MNKHKGRNRSRHSNAIPLTFCTDETFMSSWLQWRSKPWTGGRRLRWRMRLGTCWWGSCWTCWSGWRWVWTTRRNSQGCSAGSNLWRRRITRISGRMLRRSTTFSRCFIKACTIEWRTRWSNSTLRLNKCYRTRSPQTARRYSSVSFASIFPTYLRSCRIGSSRLKLTRGSSTFIWARSLTVWICRMCSSLIRMGLLSISITIMRSPIGWRSRLWGNKSSRRFLLYDCWFDYFNLFLKIINKSYGKDSKSLLKTQTKQKSIIIPRLCNINTA